VFFRTANMISQFTDGLNSSGNLWEVVKENVFAFQPIFTNMRKTITKTLFRSVFDIDWSAQGTKKREAEETGCMAAVWNMVNGKCFFFYDFLGADAIPPLGFPRRPSINFYEQVEDCRRMPRAPTCMMGIFLPKGLEDEDELKDLLTRAVRVCWF
ncbi:G2/M phase-specific E3 ubiquitin-protein ligase-like, partial [Acipenser oxyrinchus oxyrinchus]